MTFSTPKLATTKACCVEDPRDWGKNSTRANAKGSKLGREEFLFSSMACFSCSVTSLGHKLNKKEKGVVFFFAPLSEPRGKTIPAAGTGSRGDVLVVRTSKPVENLWKNGLFWSRYGFVTHSIDRKPREWRHARSAYSIKCPFFYSALRASVALRATCRAPARIWLAVIDFQKSIWVR